ncbi:MAG: transcription antitermination factor NusB [Phycisphaeraceae bacterium]
MPRSIPPRLKPNARLLAADAIANAAAQFPAIDPQSFDLASLEARERRLALAIHRTTLQRWLTLEYMINLFLKRPLRSLEPAMQGVLLTGAAQLLFMDRLPVHAVVDESVTIARRRIRPGAAGMVNAVLRRISEQADQPARGSAWSPAADRLPLDDGFLPLRSDVLPPVSFDDRPKLARHLVAATSHPLNLIERWLKQFDVHTVIEFCRHGTKTPPMIVAVEEHLGEHHPDKVVLLPSGDQAGNEAKERRAPIAPPCRDGAPADGAPHERQGFIIWDDTHAELTAFLKGHPMRRVQDVTAAEAVGATSALNPNSIIDYCAGRGTKTRQLAAMHPDATIIATDKDPGRMRALSDSFKEQPRVKVIALPQVDAQKPVDLLVLDVPCTNTGVLARRPEARYRFNEASLRSLVNLQRAICQKTFRLVKPGGHVLYSTCSLDKDENEHQIAWLIQETGCTLVLEKPTLPGGEGSTYHDGGYYALLKMK